MHLTHLAAGCLVLQDLQCKACTHVPCSACLPRNAHQRRRSVRFCASSRVPDGVGQCADSAMHQAPASTGPAGLKRLQALGAKFHTKRALPPHLPHASLVTGSVHSSWQARLRSKDLVEVSAGVDAHDLLRAFAHPSGFRRGHEQRQSPLEHKRTELELELEQRPRTRTRAFRPSASLIFAPVQPVKAAGHAACCNRVVIRSRRSGRAPKLVCVRRQVLARV